MGIYAMDATDVEEAIDCLLAKLPSNEYSRVYTIGRGGLYVAQRVGYHLDVDVIQVQHKAELGNLPKGGLFVDDIACTGETLSMVSIPTATLVTRYSSMVKPDYDGLHFNSDEYIKFNWEK